MPQSLAQIYLHLIFSTKDRRPFFVDVPFRTRVHQYLMATCTNLHCPPITAGGVADHVHILCHLGRTITVADLNASTQKRKCPNAAIPDESLRSDAPMLSVVQGGI